MQSKAHSKDSQLVHLIDRMNRSNTAIEKDPQLVADIETFLADYQPDETEIFKYGDFLKAKIGQ